MRRYGLKRMGDRDTDLPNRKYCPHREGPEHQGETAYLPFKEAAV